MSFQSPLLRQDIGDLAPAMQFALVEDAIKQIEAKEPQARTRVEVEELPSLHDMRSHLEVNRQRAREAQPFADRRDHVTCTRCGHRIALEVNAK